MARQKSTNLFNARGGYAGGASAEDALYPLTRKESAKVSGEGSTTD